jgi:hypothetical protein
MEALTSVPIKPYLQKVIGFKHPLYMGHINPLIGEQIPYSALVSPTPTEDPI